MFVRTTIDKIVEILETRRNIYLHELAAQLKAKEDVVEKILLAMEKRGIVSIHYPPLPFQKPYASLEKAMPPKSEEKPRGRVLDKYDIEAFGGHLVATVNIVFDEKELAPRYYLYPPLFSHYGEIYLEYVKDEVARILPPESTQMSDVERKSEVLLKRCSVTESILGSLGEANMKVVCGFISYKMFGLGDMEDLLSDDNVEEVIINTSQTPISLYHKKFGWMKSNVFLRGEDETANYASQIGRRVGRQITSLAPLLDAHLISGDRVNATLYPISRRGNTITIRRFSRDPWTVVKFIKNRTIAPELASMLWQAIHYELNILVVGGTASGKTSLLNTISNFIPTSQRIITIEDTRELVLSASHWNWVPMVSRLPNPEGLGEVTMLDLMINSLRMRPDRILVGEIREKTQAQVLFEAMHTGHSVYSTMHADTASEALRRLTEAPIEVPVIELESIDLIVSQFRDRKKNIRKTFEVSEIAEFVEKPSVNHIYQWRARNDSFERVNEPKRYIESLNLHTGMTAREIASDASEKTKVLEWMAKFGVEDVDSIGRVIKTYYKEPSALLAAIEKGQPPAKVI
ncbi:MAG: ATPase, T2SS/T4P/T4SS family [Candidatus Micrarchaeota archaeon]